MDRAHLEDLLLIQLVVVPRAAAKAFLEIYSIPIYNGLNELAV